MIWYLHPNSRELKLLEEWNKRQFFYVVFIMRRYFWSVHSNGSKRWWHRQRKEPPWRKDTIIGLTPAVYCTSYQRVVIEIVMFWYTLKTTLELTGWSGWHSVLKRRMYFLCRYEQSCVCYSELIFNRIRPTPSNLCSKTFPNMALLLLLFISP